MIKAEKSPFMAARVFNEINGQTTTDWNYM